jgi:cellulose synthase/poly-beta-1,6-N-acetylglucosamine synthase-like glycosyltransferase
MFGIAALFIATAIILYAIAGYPLLLRYSRRLSPDIRKDMSYRATVTVLMPVHNGAAFVRQKLESILALEYPRELVQVIVISDGSTDDTENIVREFAGREVKLLCLPHRAGKSNALNLGMRHAAGDILFFTDVRQPLKPDALAHLIANFADPTVGAVSGETDLLPGDRGEQADLGLYWRYELWARDRHSRIDSVFNASGCIYAIRRQFVETLPPDTIADDAILPLRAFFAGYRVILESCAIAHDYPPLPGTEFRRRLRTLGGLWQVYARMPELFSSRNRMRAHFLSHKFVRLVLPWALLLFAGATLALPSGSLRNVLLTGEAGFLFLAAADPLIGPASFLKRFSSLTRTFLLMNVAAALALSVFFVSAQNLWAPTRVSEPRPARHE